MKGGQVEQAVGPANDHPTDSAGSATSSPKSSQYFIRYPEIPRGASILPRVSVCIPTKNRIRTIEACLQSVRNQEYPDVEIVVVDNESTDATAQIAAKYADRLLSSPGPLGRVRQATIDAATGEILAIIDDDIVMPHPLWLRDAVQLFRAADGVATVWPRLIPPPEAGMSTRCFFALNEAIFADRIRSGRGLLGGGNSLFSRSAVERVGGFDIRADFGEDLILAARLKAAGYAIAYCEDPLIHDTMYSLREIYRKQRWGARAVNRLGWQLMQQSGWSLFREQYWVGTRAFLSGLMHAHEWSWLAYPALLGAKTLAYGLAVSERAGRKLVRRR